MGEVYGPSRGDLPPGERHRAPRSAAAAAQIRATISRACESFSARAIGAI